VAHGFFFAPVVIKPRPSFHYIYYCYQVVGNFNKIEEDDDDDDDDSLPMIAVLASFNSYRPCYLSHSGIKYAHELCMLMLALLAGPIEILERSETFRADRSFLRILDVYSMSKGHFAARLGSPACSFYPFPSLSLSFYLFYSFFFHLYNRSGRCLKLKPGYYWKTCAVF
jgi:hypothetical protein